MSFRYSAGAVRALETMVRPWLRSRIRVVHAERGPRPALSGRPVLLVANHVSWWDGFLLRQVHARLGAGAPLYTVMLERELRKRPWLRWMGCVGLEPDRPASFLRLLRGLRAARRRHPDSWIAYLPQGEIRPSIARPLGFKRGVELVSRALGAHTVLPVALHIEPLAAVRPTAFVAAGRPFAAPRGGASADRLQEAVTAEIDGLLGHLTRNGERAAARSAATQTPSMM